MGHSHAGIQGCPFSDEKNCPFAHGKLSPDHGGPGNTHTEAPLALESKSSPKAALAPSHVMGNLQFAGDMTDVISVLRSSPYFRELTDLHLALLATTVEEQTFKDGDFLIREGSPRMEAFFILDGEVERSRKVDGEKRVFEIVKPGSAFGLLHCLRGDPSYADCISKGQVRSLVMNTDLFHSILDSDAALSKHLLNSLAKTVRNYTKLVHNPVSSKPRVVLYDSKSYWVKQFNLVNEEQNLGFEISYVPELLSPHTASWAEGAVAAICFVNDDTGRDSLQRLHAGGCKMLSMRCAGFDRVDLNAARALGILVTRVPEYSPYAVAEHAMCLALSLNRNIVRASNRTKEHNFKLEGLLGFDLNGRTAGVLGTGRIGQIFINICLGFGMKVVCYDKFPNKALMESGKVTYVTQDEVLQQADVLSLHCPLLPETHHLINAENIAKMKKGVLIINCGRGALVDTPALVEGLRSGHVGGAGLDVYEYERELFFSDHSDDIMQDQVLQMLLQFSNVILTAHQAFFTVDGISQIAKVSLNNIKQYLEGKDYNSHPNVVKC